MATLSSLSLSLIIGVVHTEKHGICDQNMVSPWYMPQQTWY